jgi:hypothetical protein
MLPKLPRWKPIVQTKVAPVASEAELLKTFGTSMDQSETGRQSS